MNLKDLAKFLFGCVAMIFGVLILLTAWIWIPLMVMKEVAGG